MSPVFKDYIDVSIIIPLYRGEKFLSRLMNMLKRNCLYKGLFHICKVEVIFVNDYPDENISIDNEDNILFVTKVISNEKNKGIHTSRIKGIMSSRGIYIIMLDQDDLVMDNWIYSQWNKIISENTDVCVCNGWYDRFRILWNENNFNERINDLRYYLIHGNPICSPGQVIIKKRKIPKEWLTNIQTCNGTDDFFLWLMLLKRGVRFSVNNDCLYYHTPERNVGSISIERMLESFEEGLKIVNQLSLFTTEEIELLDRQIDYTEFINLGKIRRDKKIDSKVEYGKYLKIHKKFYILLEWLKIRNRGITLEKFFRENNYWNIAIYGIADIGECLLEELEDSDIRVKYGIDQNAKDFRQEISIYKIEDKLDIVDAVVITMTEAIEEKVKTVKEKLNCPVITISEIIFYLKCTEGI